MPAPGSPMGVVMASVAIPAPARFATLNRFSISESAPIISALIVVSAPVLVRRFSDSLMPAETR